MPAGKFLTEQAARLWKFLGFFQPVGQRVIHLLVIGLVFLQALSSIAMLPGSAVGWFHMWEGANVCVLAVLLTGYSLKRHGLRHFFPYLWGDNEQLLKDIRATAHRQLVPPRSKGLGAAVQGLGLGALLLTGFSGLIWFCLREAGSPYAPDVLAAHTCFAPLLILYVAGHGGMALAHFVVWQRTSKQS